MLTARREDAHGGRTTQTDDAGWTDGVLQCSAATKIATARSPGPPLDHGVFSKVGEGGFPVPFPRRAGPEDDHSTRALTSNFRPEESVWVQRKGSEKGRDPGGRKGRGGGGCGGEKGELGLGFDWVK